MPNIILMRHAESQFGVEGKLCGQSNPELSQTGLQQAEKVANEICLKHFQIKRIISSPLRRAFNTAQIIGGKLNLEIEVKDYLTERSFGIYEGIRFDTIPFLVPQEFVKVEHDKCWIFGGDNVESFPELQNRGRKALGNLELLLDRMNFYESILVVSHAGIMRAMYGVYNGWEWSDSYRLPVENCQTFVLKYDHD